mgnify:CR=1 FL=1
MVSPKIKRELQLFLYVFSTKFIKMWESPRFMTNLFINTDLLVFIRFSFSSFLSASNKLFCNLLILEDQEINACQFKKYYSRFLKILQNNYISNHKAFSKLDPKSIQMTADFSPDSESVFMNSANRCIFNSFYEFNLFILSIKTAILETKKFSRLMGLGSEKSSLAKEVMKFFQLGENYFGIEHTDFFFNGRKMTS